MPLSLTIVPGLPRSADEPVELARHPDAGERGVGDQRQAFAGAVVDHRQDAEAAAVEELIGDEVERPAIVGGERDRHRRPRSHRPLASAPPPHHQPFFPIEPEQPLVVHDIAFAAEQDVQATIAEAPALMRQRLHPLAQTPIVGPRRPVAHRHPADADHRARPPLAHLQRLPEKSDRLSPGGGRHHFFAISSFSAGIVEHGVGEQPLQLGVLVFQSLQPLRLRYVQAAEFGLPLVEGRAAHPMLPAQLGGRHARFLLPQDRNDLLFREPRSLHQSGPF